MIIRLIDVSIAVHESHEPSDQILHHRGVETVDDVLPVLFVGLGNYLPRMRQNYTFGIRTPWALADENNWKRTQRVGGISFMVLGVLLVVAGVVSSVVPVGDMLMAAIIVAIAICAALVPYAYSYLLFRRSRGSRKN